MLERFIEDYSEKGFQFAYHLCGDAEEAKELVQEAFYRAINRWDSYDQSQPIENWFCTLLRHLYYDSLKTYDRRNFVSLDVPLDAGEEAGTYADNIEDERDDHVLERLERQEHTDKVHEALKSLSKEHRALIVMADVQTMTYEAIGTVLDASVCSVRGKLCRARKAFREALVERSLGEAPGNKEQSEEVSES